MRCADLSHQIKHEDRAAVASTNVLVEHYGRCATGSYGVLRMDAREAGAGARGGAPGAAKRAIVGLVAGNVHFQKRAGGDIQFEAAAAAIDEGACGDGQGAFLLDYADGFARRAAGGPDIFDYQDALAGLEFEAAAQGHLAGAVAFDEERANAEGARHFVADDDAAQRRRNHTCDREIAEKLGEGSAERVGVLRMREDERALDVGGAVASAG